MTEGIREMIIENSGRSFESCRSMNQELTFKEFAAQMEGRSIAIGPAQMKTLKLIGEDGLYTNLALLLSDQCETTIKVALFQGIDKEVFRDRKEFSGSILKQLEDVYEFIDLVNKTKASFSGLNRTDKRDYPEEAVREALLNSVVHRDYSFSGSNLINIYEDRIEFVSLGGLVSGLELKSIFLGVSQSRNPNLAACFYRMRLIESYGTGIGKIQRAYKGESLQPEFETAKGVFRVTLPNRNEIAQKKGKKCIMSNSSEYELLAQQLQALIEGEPDQTANLSNASAAINEALDNINWAGFYLVKDGMLVLGPFQGKPACIRIPFGKGVCGTAAQKDQTQLVKDVHEFPGHIACDSASRSEIVIPIHDKNGAVAAVLDIDSPYLARFDETDQTGLEHCVKILEKYLVF